MHNCAQAKPQTIHTIFKPQLNMGESAYTPSLRPRLIEVIHKYVTPGYSGIVYCALREDVNTVARILEVAHISAVAHHAGMNTEARTLVQRQWLTGEAQVSQTSILSRTLRET